VEVVVSESAEVTCQEPGQTTCKLRTEERWQIEPWREAPELLSASPSRLSPAPRIVHCPELADGQGSLELGFSGTEQSRGEESTGLPQGGTCLSPVLDTQLKPMVMKQSLYPQNVHCLLTLFITEKMKHFENSCSQKDTK
jgi:hypothetical protein